MNNYHLNKNLTLFFLLIIISVLSLNLVSSIQIIPVKAQFSKGETFLATLQGNILNPIQKKDVFFYRGNVRMGFNYDLEKINNTYYISAILPYDSRNYSLIIKNVYFSEFNQFKKSDIELNFTISNETADFNVDPALFITTKNISINLHNNLELPLVINYNFDNSDLTLNSSTSHSITIPPQATSSVVIPIYQIKSTQAVFLKVSSSALEYSLPAYIIKQSNETSNNGNTGFSPQNSTVAFSQRKISVELNKDESYFDSISIKNNGNREVDDISIALSDNLKNYVFIPQNKITSLMPGQEISLNFTAKFPQTGNFSGFIYASFENSSDISDMEFFIGDQVTSNTSIPGTTSCSGLGGNKCTSTQFCSGGTNVNSLEGLCCLGQCQDFSAAQGGSSQNWWAIGAVILILLIIGTLLFLKYRKPKTSYKKILQEKEDSFSDRFETSGKLSKV